MQEETLGWLCSLGFLQLGAGIFHITVLVHTWPPSTSFLVRGLRVPTSGVPQTVAGVSVASSRGEF